MQGSILVSFLGQRQYQGLGDIANIGGLRPNYIASAGVTSHPLTEHSAIDAFNGTPTVPPGTVSIVQ